MRGSKVKGKQIIYLPEIAGKNLNHPARRTGFISEVGQGGFHCWLWRKDEQNRTFHTVVDKEPVFLPVSNVFFADTIEQKYVDHWITKLEDDGKPNNG